MLRNKIWKIALIALCITGAFILPSCATTKKLQIDMFATSTFRNDGRINAGGWVHFWETSAKTTTKNVYADVNGTQILEQPIQLDQRGARTIFASGPYYIELYDRHMNLIKAYDSFSYTSSIDFYGIDVFAEYGRTNSEMQALINILNPTNNFELLFRGGDAGGIKYDMDGLTWPENASMKILRGAMFTGSAITINGAIDAGDYQFVETEGACHFGGTPVRFASWDGGPSGLYKITQAEIDLVTGNIITWAEIDVLGDVSISGNIVIDGTVDGVDVSDLAVSATSLESTFTANINQSVRTDASPTFVGVTATNLTGNITGTSAKYQSDTTDPQDVKFNSVAIEKNVRPFNQGAIWTPVSVEAVEWRSVTYGNGVFVAVGGGGTNRVMYSHDGISWTPVSVEAVEWRSVTYGNGMFVAVGEIGTNRVMYSGRALENIPAKTGNRVFGDIQAQDVKFNSLNLGTATGAEAGQLRTSAGIRTGAGVLYGTDSPTGPIMGIRDEGFSINRAVLSLGGDTGNKPGVAFGDGTANADTNLYRDSANVLKTDGSLVVGGHVTTFRLASSVGAGATRDIATLVRAATYLVSLRSDGGNLYRIAYVATSSSADTIEVLWQTGSASFELVSSGLLLQVKNNGGGSLGVRASVLRLH